MVGQLGHRGRHGGAGGDPGAPRPRTSSRPGLPLLGGLGSRARTFDPRPRGGRVPARLTAAPSRPRDWAAGEPGLSCSSAGARPRRRPPLFWWPWRGAGPAASRSPAFPGGGGAHGAEDARGSARMLPLDRLRASRRCGRRVWVALRRSPAARLR